MSNRGYKNGSPPDSFERFEDLARRLFTAKKSEVAKEKAEYKSAQVSDRKAKAAFAIKASALKARRLARRFMGKDGILRCSFCGKDKDHVQFLIAGPTVFICGKCVELCVDIIDKCKASGQAPPLPPTA